VQPLLIVAILALVALNDFLRGVSYRLGVIAVFAITIGLTIVGVTVVGAMVERCGAT
jgi:hypothetical protein